MRSLGKSGDNRPEAFRSAVGLPCAEDSAHEMEAGTFGSAPDLFCARLPHSARNEALDPSLAQPPWRALEGIDLLPALRRRLAMWRGHHPAWPRIDSSDLLAFVRRTAACLASAVASLFAVFPGWVHIACHRFAADLLLAVPQPFAGAPLKQVAQASAKQRIENMAAIH